jgi:hypothetical protein
MHPSSILFIEFLTKERLILSWLIHPTLALF